MRTSNSDLQPHESTLPHLAGSMQQASQAEETSRQQAAQHDTLSMRQHIKFSHESGMVGMHGTKLLQTDAHQTHTFPRRDSSTAGPKALQLTPGSAQGIEGQHLSSQAGPKQQEELTASSNADASSSLGYNFSVFLEADDVLRMVANEIAEDNAYQEQGAWGPYLYDDAEYYGHDFDDEYVYDEYAYDAEGPLTYIPGSNSLDTVDEYEDYQPYHGPELDSNPGDFYAEQASDSMDELLEMLLEVWSEMQEGSGSMSSGSGSSSSMLQLPGAVAADDGVL